eukprot:scaffold149527_cov30-Tisochrysis_lutea.AAC.7
MIRVFDPYSGRCTGTFDGPLARTLNLRSSHTLEGEPATHHPSFQASSGCTEASFFNPHPPHFIPNNIHGSGRAWVHENGT